MRRLTTIFAATIALGSVLLVSAASSADTLDVHLVSQTTNNITLGWTPQAGYGYLFSTQATATSQFVVVSRTNNANASTVQFAKGSFSYEVAVIVKGNNGHYPPPAALVACNNNLDDDADGKIDFPADPGCTSATDTSEADPPPTTSSITQTIVNGSTIANINNWRAVYDADGNGTEDDPGSIRFLVDGTQVLSEINAPFGDTFANGTITVSAGSHTFRVDAVNGSNVVVATNTVTATISGTPPPVTQCSDGIDNADPEDTLIDMADPGCANPSDNDETNSVTPPPTGYPDLSNTGVPSGTTLTAYTGPDNVTVANTVIDGKIMGCMDISAPGVVIRNSRISCNGSFPILVNSGNLLIEDSELDCKDVGGTAIAFDHVTARRLDIYKCENGFSIDSDMLIEDSYIHDLTQNATAHPDGIQCGTPCDNITIRHNTIYGTSEVDGSQGNAAIISGRGGMHNFILDNNLLAGGGYTLYCSQDSTYLGTSGVFNNKFSTRFSPKVGFYGPSADCSDENLSGNVYYETGLPINLG